MKTRMIIYVCLFLLLCVSLIYIAQRKQMPTGLTGGKRAYKKQKDTFPIDTKKYYSNINNIRVHWLKPKQISNTKVRISWLPLKPEIIKLSKIKTYNLSVIDKKYGKYVLSERNFGLKDPCSYIYKLAFGEYTFCIKASDGKKYTKENKLDFTVGKYQEPIDKETKHSIIYEFYNLYYQNVSLLGSVEKALANQIEELKSEEIIKHVKFDSNRVYVEFIDNSQIYLFIKNLPESISTSDIILDIQDDGEQEIDRDRAPVLNRGPIHPFSNRAIVLDGIEGTEDDWADNPREHVIDYLTQMGYDVTVRVADEATIEEVADLDDGRWGVIYYHNHGSPDCIMTNSYYEQEPEEDEYIGTETTALRDPDTGEIRYYIWFTSDFINEYCNDMPFPNSFIYFYSCGTGITHDPRNERLFRSFYDKGVTCGYVGMNAAVARFVFNNPGTKKFFRSLTDRGTYLVDAIEVSRPSDLELAPDIAAYNKLFYIGDDPPFVDLGIRRIERSGRNLKVVVGNEGTLALRANREFAIGVKGWRQEDWERTVNVELERRFYPGRELEVVIAPPREAHSITVGLDINDDIIEDEIRSNNTREVLRDNILPPDLVISRYNPLRIDANRYIQIAEISIRNIGTGKANVSDCRAFRIDTRIHIERGWECWHTVGLEFPVVGIEPGETYSTTFSIPIAIAVEDENLGVYRIIVPEEIDEVELMVDSSNIIEELNENNNLFRFGPRRDGHLLDHGVDKNWNNRK